MYKCGKCKKEVKALDQKFTRCPPFGWRVLYKARHGQPRGWPIASRAGSQLPIAKEVSTD